MSITTFWGWAETLPGQQSPLLTTCHQNCPGRVVHFEHKASDVLAGLSCLKTQMDATAPTSA
eukprot:1157762-Pelagomonas_calceolata.AAC.5